MFWSPPKFPDEGFYDVLDFGVYELAHGLGNRGLAAHQVGFKEHYNAKKGKLLDIGCSDGAFLAWAQGQGFDAYGIDVDTNALERARKITENVWPMQLDQFVCYARERDFRFDVVTMFEVLEHQPQPRQFLSDALTLLSSDGWISGTVPNRERLLKTGRTPQENWGDFPPHHFLWFDEGALKKALSSFGLVDVRVQDRMHGYWIEERVHVLGKPFKRRFTGSATCDPLPLERLQEAGIELKQRTVRLLYGFRGLRDILKLPPKALEAAIEIIFRKGGSLYFQARLPG
jgi:SAM-dependent methyltransferase